MMFVNLLAARARRWLWLPAFACLIATPVAAQEQCNWNNDALFPLCTSAGIINPDGWGWENQASCISRDLCTSNQNSGGVVNAASSTSSGTSSSSTASLPVTNLGGWRVSGSQILDPNGQVFVFRGVNHAHTWFTSRLNQSLADIAAAGANAVRVVLSNGTHGTGWQRNNGADVSNVINQCKLNKLVCVLEVHDSTGYGESAGATHISNATAYWLSDDIRAAIDGEEDYVIVNIANEPFGNQTTTTTYVDDTKAAITALRNGGITHMLMVDGSTWGQDWQGAMRDNAADILAADSYANVVFSVHMYEVYDSASKVQAYMNSFVSRNLALVVGEFGHEHNGSNVAEEAILQYAEQLGIGYLGWSWSGNGSCCTSLDIVTNWNANSFGTWGDILFNSEYGIKATAQLASIFTEATSSSSVSSQAVSSQVASSQSTASQSASSVASSVASSSQESSVAIASSSSAISTSTSASSSVPASSSLSSSSSVPMSSSSSSLVSSVSPSSTSISSAIGSSAPAISSDASSATTGQSSSSEQGEPSSSSLASSAYAFSSQASSQSLSSADVSSVAASSSSVWVISSAPASSAASSASSTAVVIVSSSSQQASSQAPEPGGSASSQMVSSLAPQSSAASGPASSAASSVVSSASSMAVSSQAAQSSSVVSSPVNSGGGGGGSVPWHSLGLLVLFVVGRRFFR